MKAFALTIKITADDADLILQEIYEALPNFPFPFEIAAIEEIEES